MPQILRHDTPVRFTSTMSPEDLANAEDRLMPMLVRRADLPPKHRPQRIWREWRSDLVICYVLDDPTQYYYLGPEALRFLKMTEQEIYERAITNLRARTEALPPPLATPQEGLTVVECATGDGYDATRILLPDVIGHWLGVAEEQQVIAAIPHRDLLLAISETNADKLPNLLLIAERVRSAGWVPLTKQAFIILNDRVIGEAGFSPPKVLRGKQIKRPPTV